MFISRWQRRILALKRSASDVPAFASARGIAIGMTPVRVQLRRTKGWKMPPNTVKVDRSTEWGNPFVIGKFGLMDRIVIDGESAVGHFREMLRDPEIRACANYHADLSPLRGKNLACWCTLDQPCHADELLRVANQKHD